MSDKLPDYFPKPRKNPLNHYTVNLNECTTKGSTVHKEIDFTTCNLVILSPSFGCPGIFEKGKDIVLYVLADFNFFSVQQDENDPNGECLKERVINYHLKINKWSDSQTQKESCGIEDKLLYTKGNAVGNIKCTLLDYLGEREEDIGDGRTRTLPPERRIYSDSVYSKKAKKDKDLVACIRDSTLDYYLCKNQKAHKSEKNSKPPEEPDELKNRPPLPFLYKIELKPDTMQTPPVENELYDVAWFITKAKRSAIEFGELQDLACEHVACDKSRALKPTKLFKVKDGKIDDFTLDDKSPIQAYHPFIVSGKPHLNLGQLSDVHLSARQAAFRKSKVCVFEGGVQTDTSCLDLGKPIGETLNTTLDSFCDMFKQMGDDSTIDAIVITGDLIDFNQNYLPKDELTPGQLWEMMHHDKHKDEKLYPRYVDSLVVLSLIKAHYDRCKKPVFIISGNHEHYQDAYGISPRVGDSLGGGKKGFKRANAGVPADHNLTIYEACLMYGPDFGWYSKVFNFKKSYADWFYHLFTPLTDFRVTFKEQTIVALGWGDDEDLFSNVSASQFSPDTSLYRSAKSVSDIQLELVKAGIRHGKQRLILSHFPFASYDNKWSLDVNAKMDCTDNFIAKSFDDYSQGSFKQNRVKMHEYLSNKDYHYTLSGHSHRAGLYEGDFDNGFATASYSITGHEIPAAPDAPLALPVKGKSNMIVCGCSGPVGIQNRYSSATEKGLGSWGLDYPAGNHITLAAGSEKIKRVIPSIKSAQPRFAVALDYMDIIGRESDKQHHGVFTSITSDAAGGTFTFTVNPDLPKVRFIDEISIVAYLEGKFKAYPMTVEGTGVLMGAVGVLSDTQVLKGALSENDADDLKKMLTPKEGKESKSKLFLAITFNKALEGLTGYKQYNFDSPWIIPIEIVERKELARQKLKNTQYHDGTTNAEIERQVSMVSGYVIRRHPDCGEIPNHVWYSKTFGYGYDFDKKPKKK